MKLKYFLHEFKRRLTSEIRTCHNCGTFCTDCTLCSYCWESLTKPLPDSRQTPLRIELEPAKPRVRLLALFGWAPGRDQCLSKMIEALKGGGSDKDFARLARELYNRRLSQGSITENLVFIPAPSRNGKFDHSMAWAEALAKAFGGQLSPCLTRASVVQQKDLKRSERSRIKLNSSEKFSLSMDRIVFVDDVVTSGATARAAYSALGRPCYFEVWTIAYRHLAASDTL
jgi:predicted amidophosphoribosyltransferase